MATIASAFAGKTNNEIKGKVAMTVGEGDEFTIEITLQDTFFDELVNNAWD